MDNLWIIEKEADLQSQEVYGNVMATIVYDALKNSNAKCTNKFNENIFKKYLKTEIVKFMSSQIFFDKAKEVKDPDLMFVAGVIKGVMNHAQFLVYNMPRDAINFKSESLEVSIDDSFRNETIGEISKMIQDDRVKDVALKISNKVASFIEKDNKEIKDEIEQDNERLGTLELEPITSPEEMGDDISGVNEEYPTLDNSDNLDDVPMSKPSEGLDTPFSQEEIDANTSTEISGEGDTPSEDTGYGDNLDDIPMTNEEGYYADEEDLDIGEPVEENLSEDENPVLPNTSEEETTETSEEDTDEEEMTGTEESIEEDNIEKEPEDNVTKEVTEKVMEMVMDNTDLDVADLGQIKEDIELTTEVYAAIGNLFCHLKLMTMSEFMTLVSNALNDRVVDDSEPTSDDESNFEEKDYDLDDGEEIYSSGESDDEAIEGELEDSEEEEEENLI